MSLLSGLITLASTEIISNLKYRGLGHSAALEELDDVERFLQDKLPPQGDKTSDEGKSEL